MTDKRTELYFKLLRENDRLFGALLKSKASKGDRQKAAFCLTEIYFISQSLVKLTKKISETNLEFSKGDLNSLLGNLIDLRIEIYDKMVDWIRDLKKPLNVVIDKVGELEGDKSGANAARKIIRSSMKQINVNMEKIKYYSAHYKPSKKRKK